MSREEGGAGLGLFILGAAVGAALGLLFAPASGEETRERIGGWLKKRREEGSDLLRRLKDEVPTKKEQVAAAVKAGREAYREAGRHRGDRDAVTN